MLCPSKGHKVRTYDLIPSPIRNLFQKMSLANKALNEQVLNLLNLERQDFKRMENWMDKNGNVEKIVVFGNDNQIIKTVFVSIL